MKKDHFKMQCTVKNFKKLAESIQERAFLHMWTLEGVTDINLEKQLEQKKNKSQRKKPFLSQLASELVN